MPLKLLLRIVLGALICLNGTTALWASTRMALEHGTSHDATADVGHGPRSSHATTDPACGETGCTAPDAGEPDAGTRHEHAPGEPCFCGDWTLSGCSCSCGFTAGFITVSVPFVARHSLHTAPPAYAEIHAPRRSTGAIFRPPIG